MMREDENHTKPEKLLGFVGKLGKDKLALCIFTGVLLLIIAIPSGEKKTLSIAAAGSQEKTQKTRQDEIEKADYEIYKEKLETELESFLDKMEGVGKAEVLVFMEQGEETVLQDRNAVATKTPRIQGVLVLCRGTVQRSEVTRMLANALQLESYQVQVGKMRE